MRHILLLSILLHTSLGQSNVPPADDLLDSLYRRYLDECDRLGGGGTTETNFLCSVVLPGANEIGLSPYRRKEHSHTPIWYKDRHRIHKRDLIDFLDLPTYGHGHSASYTGEDRKSFTPPRDLNSTAVSKSYVKNFKERIFRSAEVTTGFILIPKHSFK